MTAWGLPHTLHYASTAHSGAQRRGTLPYRPPDRAAPRIRTLVDAGLFSWPAKRDGDPDSNKRAMRRDGACKCLKSRAAEDKKTGNIKKKWKRNFSLLLFLYACMHSVCTLYASPTAYIFSPSALRTRLFAFLYALYAVNSGVVFSHSMHSRFFDAYNAYKSRPKWFAVNCGRLRPRGTGNEARWVIRTAVHA